MIIHQKIIEVAEMTKFIQSDKDNNPMQKVCEILVVPKSTYDQSLYKIILNRERETINKSRE